MRDHDQTADATVSAPPSGPFDATAGLARDPYRYIHRMCADLDTAIFASRLLLRPAVFMSGRDAAVFFYSGGLVRDGAMPGFAIRTLFGAGGVQGLDGDAHRRRKADFLSLTRERHAPGIAERVESELAALDRSGTAVPDLQRTMELLLARVALAWADVPVPPDEVEARAGMIADLFRHVSPLDRRHLAARLARRRADRWAADLVEKVRTGSISPRPGSALGSVAAWRDESGALLAPKVAGVELLNLLRPIVAISVYVTFAAHALARHPGARDSAASGDGVRRFVQEVRRLYPFFPMLAARAPERRVFQGNAIPAGTRVVLDVHGVNRDPSVWADPDAFDPSRFAGREIGAFDMIPQGGGDHASGHRCPGEWFTIAVMEACVPWLARRIGAEATAAAADLRMDALPALPRKPMTLPPLDGRRGNRVT